MSVRISGGELRGRNIVFPSVSGLRPTSSRIREAVFSALAGYCSIQGANVADFFAGSGMLGFEALSRGASRLSCFELNKALLKAIEKNAKDLNLDSVVRASQLHIEKWLQKPKELFVRPVEIVFIDPPYDLDLEKNVAAKLIARLLDVSSYCNETVFVVEQSVKSVEMSEQFKSLDCHELNTFWSRDYGDTKVTFVKSGLFPQE